jgi:hypothetical protein
MLKNLCNDLMMQTGLPISPIAEKTTMKSAFCMLFGELMYIAINTRPEISYAVNQCSRYMTKATKTHYEVLKHILRYLAGVKHLRITWCASTTLKKGFKFFQMYSYADTIWEDDKNSRKSTCCDLVFVHNAAFSWSSFMSPILCFVPFFTSSSTRLKLAYAFDVQYLS